MSAEKPSAERLLQPEVETLSAKFHEIYQSEAKRQGDVRHKDDYACLSENVKEFDRVLARYVLSHFTAQPNPFIVNAVRLAYYTGDFKGAIDVIAEAVGENLLASDGKAANLAAEGET